MRNTIAFDLVLLASGVLVIGLMGWVLIDGLRTGRLPLKGGGNVHRARTPVGFWLLAGLMVAIMSVACVGYATLLVDLVAR